MPHWPPACHGATGQRSIRKIAVQGVAMTSSADPQAWQCGLCFLPGMVLGWVALEYTVCRYSATQAAAVA